MYDFTKNRWSAQRFIVKYDEQDKGDKTRQGDGSFVLSPYLVAAQSFRNAPLLL